MKDRKIERRDFLKLTAAAAIAPSVLTATAGAQEKKKLYKALIINMLPGALSDAEKFRLAKKCGFEGIEAKPMKDLKAAAEQAKIAREEGTPIHSLLYGWWPPFTNRDPKVVGKSIESMQNALRCAKVMGADAVLLVPTRVTEDFSYQDAYKWSQEYVSRLIPTAEQTGVTVAVENVWNKFLLSPIEFARYLDELSSRWVKAYFDVGNVIIYGHAHHWIRTLGKRLVKIHLKDFKRNGYQWKNLLDGDVNWPQVRKALDEVGYNGYMTAELSGGSEAKLTDISERIDQIIAMK
ncbi:MAG: sugar phosphate isomerase/epimerase family protein [Planctomycetota bacterium]|jgi:hexulose-6-phosphate isomerase